MFKKLSVLAIPAAFAALTALGCSEAEKPLTPVYKTPLPRDELRISAFGALFPKEYATFMRNDETAIMTEYKGSIPYHKNDDVNPLPVGFRYAQPYLKNLWLGYPFSFEYNEARGHTYAVLDILEIDRINRYDVAAGMPATCWNCKTPKIPSWVAEYGDDKFWAMNFNEFRTADKIDVNEHTIGCANCHDPQTMELAITSFPLDEALRRQGKDWRTMSRNEMRSLVCAQCHVEYYFQEAKYGPNRKPVLPWDNGMDPESVYEYYKSHGVAEDEGFGGQFFDFRHPASKVLMIKLQHPEYETWYNGPHGAAGVSCADCHMPYVRVDGETKVSSHHWTSPLKTPQGIDSACRQCHTDKSAEYLRERVIYTQRKTFENLLSAQDMSVRAHEAVRLANEWTGEKSGEYARLMIQAREMVRRGQFYWDYLSAENSVGFHNPVKALDTAQKSLEYSQMAVNYAMQATNYGIAPGLEGDIRQIVPPILEWSREKQMDADALAAHVWTRYLAPLPQSGLMWRGQEKIR